jgi:hypothetical protein
MIDNEEILKAGSIMIIRKRNKDRARTVETLINHIVRDVSESVVEYLYGPAKVVGTEFINTLFENEYFELSQHTGASRLNIKIDIYRNEYPIGFVDGFIYGFRWCNIMNLLIYGFDETMERTFTQQGISENTAQRKLDGFRDYMYSLG